MVTVVRFGEEDELRRAERVDGGWVERGHLVNFYVGRTPSMDWRETGTCWAGTRHRSSRCPYTP